MTYFGFLFWFVGIPTIILTVIHLIDRRPIPQPLQSWPAPIVIAALVVVAVAYTTPWDNYLVYSRVWWYDINLVNGLVIGYVPIEEYTFFVVQTIMTGLFTWWLMKLAKPAPEPSNPMRIRVVTTGVLAVIWLISTIILIATFFTPASSFIDRFTYLTLELSWALIPIMLQTAVGADILWRHRRVVIPSILVTWLYLSAADAIAIASGTWTINPEKSLPILIGGILPIEEAIFFLITNVLVVFGLTLVVAYESESRVPQAMKNWLQQQKPSSSNPRLENNPYG